MQRDYNGQLTPEQRIEKNTLSVLVHPKYKQLAGVVMMGRTAVDDTHSTACTDGLNTFYGREFIGTQPDPKLRFIILHETLHKAFRHLSTWRWMWKEDPDRANQACDYVINLLLVKADAGEGFIKIPSCGLLDTRFDGMDSGEVFRLLGAEGGGGEGGFDEHDWGAAQGRSAEAEKALEGQVEDALRKGGVLAGTMPGSLARAVGEVLAPKVDWRAELWEFVTALCKGHDISTWRRPHRRSIDSGVYTPSSYSEAVGRMVVGADTSGSISGAFVSQFLGEIVGLCNTVNPELLDLLYWDSRVAGHEKYAQGQYETILTSTKPKGGGGTAPSCVSTYLREQNIKPECVVMLTDGYVGTDWGYGWPCPVLWCVVNNKRAIASTGRTLHVEI